MSRFPLLGFLLLIATGCNHPATPPATAGQPVRSAPADVKTVKPERKTLRRTVEQPGHIEAFEQAPLHVKIPGFVRKVHADIGDTVRGPQGDKPGQVLAELWVPEMEEELKQKQAMTAVAKAEIEQSRAALAAAGANLKSAQAKVAEVQSGRARALAEANRWQGQFQREQELVKRKVIEQQALDETRFQFEAARTAAEEVEAKVRSAQANEDESKARQDKAAADIRVAQARLLIAEADERRLEALLHYARITAPFDGIVTRRGLDTGHFVLPPAAGKGEPVFVVARLDPVRVFVDVPETDVLQIQKDAVARIRVQAVKGQEFTGKVTRSSWALDARSRTLRTEIVLPNPAGQLRPGMYAYAVITVEYPNVFTLPASAVVVQGEQAYCFVIEHGKAVRTPLRIGVRDGASVEVHKKQLKADTWTEVTGEEEVIAGNLTGLTDGQAVRRQ